MGDIKSSVYTRETQCTSLGNPQSKAAQGEVTNKRSHRQSLQGQRRECAWTVLTEVATRKEAQRKGKKGSDTKAGGQAREGVKRGKN